MTFFRDHAPPTKENIQVDEYTDIADRLDALEKKIMVRVERVEDLASLVAGYMRDALRAAGAALHNLAEQADTLAWTFTRQPTDPRCSRRAPFLGEYAERNAA
jgi:hypothetical protein